MTSRGGKQPAAKGLLAPAFALAIALFAGACGEGPGGGGGGGDSGEEPPVASAGDAVVVAAAGDIACDGCDQPRTAEQLLGLHAEGRLGAILAVGDLAYPEGRLVDFTSHYAPTWGRPELLALTRPVPGNHEYHFDGSASGYFDYFNGAGAADGRAGRRDRGYYSFDLELPAAPERSPDGLLNGSPDDSRDGSPDDSWHVVALNSNDSCHDVACGPGSPQEQWLRADLAAHPRACTLAFWHHPRFQAGGAHGDTDEMAPLWDALVDAGADVVVSAHEHSYQQLAPLDRHGTVDAARGMRSFVVGTGGTGQFHGDRLRTRQEAVEAFVTDTNGVLELSLLPGGYTWRFLPAGGGAVPPGASGAAACH